MDDVLQSTILSYDQVTAACFTHNGQRLLSAADDGQIRVRIQLNYINGLVNDD